MAGDWFLLDRVGGCSEAVVIYSLEILEVRRDIRRVFDKVVRSPGWWCEEIWAVERCIGLVCYIVRRDIVREDMTLCDKGITRCRFPILYSILVFSVYAQIVAWIYQPSIEKQGAVYRAETQIRVKRARGIEVWGPIQLGPFEYIAFRECVWLDQAILDIPIAGMNGTLNKYVVGSELREFGWSRNVTVSFPDTTTLATSKHNFIAQSRKMRRKDTGRSERQEM